MAIEPGVNQPEILVEEEPRYLRRQRRVEIPRREFGGRSWPAHKRVVVGVALALVGAWLLYQVLDFSLYSPLVILARPEQIELTGNHHVDRGAVVQKFAVDRGRSVLRVPLHERRRVIEEIAWVEQASVERILPNRIRVELEERTPVAFLRRGNELALIDAYGVILDRPLEGEFRFPVVSGIVQTMPRPQREQRIKLYVEFLKEVEAVRPGLGVHVSEVDLSDSNDLRAVIGGMSAFTPGSDNPGTVLVHFGDGDFGYKFKTFVDNIHHWRASAGRVESVDLRFSRQVVVNPEKSKTVAGATK